MIIRSLDVGPIQGWTTQTEVRLWGRGHRHTLDGRPLRTFGVCQLRKANGQIVNRVFKMRSHFDMTGIAQFDGLTSATTYDYRMGYVLAELEQAEMEAALQVAELQWQSPDWKPIRTAPAATSEIGFSFGSCRYLSRFEWGDERGDKTFREILDRATTEPNDFFLMVGDQIYADDFNVLDPDTKLEEFWEKYRNAFSQPHLRELMSRTPTYMILDDHEITNDWDADRRLPENDPKNYNRRLFKRAMQAYESYQFIHSPGFRPEGRRGMSDIPSAYYFSYRVGNSDFFVLDTRTERSPGSGYMLAPEQEKALLDWLDASVAAYRFIVTSVPFFPEPKKASDDKWGGYHAQRARILNHIVDNQIARVTFLSGDIHSSGCATLVREDVPSHNIHQVISSPFWWPASPGNDKYFRRGSLVHDSDTPFKVTSARYFTDRDNWVRVSTVEDGLKVVCRDRKGAQLASHTLRF